MLIVLQERVESKNGESDLNDIIFRTLGALGISMKREVAKNDIRLRASKFAGMSVAVSSTVSSK